MSDARKPSEDAIEGLGLLFRAAGKIAREVERELKQDVDVAKLAAEAGKLAGKASQEVLRAAGAVGREIDRAATSAARAMADEPRRDPPPGVEANAGTNAEANVGASAAGTPSTPSTPVAAGEAAGGAPGPREPAESGRPPST